MSHGHKFRSLSSHIWRVVFDFCSDAISDVSPNKVVLGPFRIYYLIHQFWLVSKYVPSIAVMSIPSSLGRGDKAIHITYKWFFKFSANNFFTPERHPVFFN